MVIELDRDIVISDDEFSNINKDINNFSTHYAEKLEKYLAIITQIINNGITSGVVHDNLLLFQDSLIKLKDEVDEFYLSLSNSNDKMIEDFDTADNSLF